MTIDVRVLGSDIKLNHEIIMPLLTTKLPSGRWGIYRNDNLLLTVGSQQTLDAILMHLSRRQIPVKVVAES